MFNCTNEQGANSKEKEININSTITVDITDKGVKEVLRAICACLNIKSNQTRKLTIVKEKTTTGIFDKWYEKIEKKTEKLFHTHVQHVTDFLRREGDCGSEFLTLSVDSSPNLCSFSINLYYPSASSAYPVDFKKAVDILSQEGPLELLPTIENRTYKLNQIVEGLRNENIDIQFKEINGRNVPNTLENMCSHYISAFGNYKGGVIYFGINDESGKVVGVDLSSFTTTAIDIAVKKKIGGMFYGKKEKLLKGTHWDIQYFDVEKDGTKNISMPNRKIITVSVCRIPGGVFTAIPESYYADKYGKVQKSSLCEWRSKMIESYGDAPFTNEGGFEIQRSLANMSNDILIIKETVISENLASQSAKTKQTETTPQEECQNCTAKKRQVSLPETETTSSKPKIHVSPIARSTDPENTCLQTETTKEEKSTANDIQELQVRYLTSKLEKMEKEKRKLDLENESLERRASYEQNQSNTFEQTREALGLIADQTEKTSQEESLNGSKLNCAATKRQVLLPETETISNKPKILVPPLSRPTDHEITCRQNEPIKESKSTADDIQELQVKVLTGKLEKLEKEKKKLDLEIGCLERRGSQEHITLMTFEQFFEALELTAEKVALIRQMPIHQPKTTSSRKIANVAPLERQTDTDKTVHQTEAASVSQEQVLEM